MIVFQLASDIIGDLRNILSDIRNEENILRHEQVILEEVIENALQNSDIGNLRHSLLMKLIHLLRYIFIDPADPDRLLRLS